VFNSISENNTQAKALSQFLIQHDSIELEERLLNQAASRLESLIAALERLEATRSSKSALESLISDQRAVESLPRLDAAIEALEGLIAVRNSAQNLKALLAEQIKNESDISAINEKIPKLLESGGSIVEMTKKKRETLHNILGSLRAVRDEFQSAADAAKETEARLAELEKPSRCQACGKCVMYCETC
jgi:DNA repair ATPase RecN